MYDREQILPNMLDPPPPVVNDMSPRSIIDQADLSITGIQHQPDSHDMRVILEAPV